MEDSDHNKDGYLDPEDFMSVLQKDQKKNENTSIFNLYIIKKLFNILSIIVNYKGESNLKMQKKEWN